MSAQAEDFFSLTAMVWCFGDLPHATVTENTCRESVSGNQEVRLSRVNVSLFLLRQSLPACSDKVSGVLQKAHLYSAI